MDILYIVGSGGPVATPEAFGTSLVLRSGDDYLMFDCGPAATHKMVKMGLSPGQIDHLFFTHHHSDHDLDYPAFLLTRWFDDAGQLPELQVFGPEPTELLTRRLIDLDEGAFAHDFKVRMNHPMSLAVYEMYGGKLPRRGPAVKTLDIGPGKVCEGEDWEVVAAPAKHVEPWLDSLAYRFNGSQGSVVFTGDTAPCDTVAELAEGTDVLVVNCVGLEDEIAAWGGNEYMIGSKATGRLACDVGAKKLVLTHNTYLMKHGPMERGIAEIAREFDGEVINGEEMLEVRL